MTSLLPADIQSADVDLMYSQSEEDLRSTLHDILASDCPSKDVIALYDGDRALVAPLWRSVGVELGLAGVIIPEEYGGAGGSLRDAATVLEELGFANAPVPFLTSAVVATIVVLQAESARVPELLAAMAAGRSTSALLTPWAADPYSHHPTVQSDGDRLRGTVRGVAGALEADILLVPAQNGARTSIYAVQANAVDMVPVVSLDMTRQLADITVDVPAATVIVADGEPVLAQALTAGAGLLASEQLGLARWCLKTTTDYLSGRYQFGRIVGGFQSLKHRLADVYAEIELGTSVARYAAATLADDEPDAPVAAAVAQAFCGDLAVYAAEEALQLHGGVGMTWEYPLHLYLKRSKSNQIALGNPAAHRARLGELIDLLP